VRGGAEAASSVVDVSDAAPVLAHLLFFRKVANSVEVVE